MILSEASRKAADLAKKGMDPRKLQLKGRQEPVAAWAFNSAHRG